MISNGIDIDTFKKNFEVLCKSLGFMIDVPNIPIFKGKTDGKRVLLIEGAENIPIPLNWLFKPNEADEYIKKCKKLNKKNIPCFDEVIGEMSYIRMMTPCIYPVGMGTLPIRVLFTGVSEITNECYAVVYYGGNSDTLSYHKWFKGDTFRIVKLSADKEYRWLNWLSIDGIRYPVTDSYIVNLYHRVYNKDEFVLRSNMDTLSWPIIYQRAN